MLALWGLPVALLVSACARTSAGPAPEGAYKMPNPIAYVEIPATDLARAALFYRNVFGFELDPPTQVDGYDMIFLPFQPEARGVTAALVKGDVYVPSTSGPIVYFYAEDIAATLDRAKEAGGQVLYPIKSVGEFGQVAEFQDSEGNRIALHQPLR